MDDQSPRRRELTGTILVTGASGTVGQAVADALAAAGETVVAGMRDPRAWLAESARRASGTAAGQQPDRAGGRPDRPGASGPGPGQGRPGAGRTGAGPLGKPPRAPNQKPTRSPAHKPASRPGVPVGTAHPGEAAVATAADSSVIVRAFDFADRSTWARALAGVDRVFLLVPPTISDVGRTLLPFIDQAMEEADVRQIVFLSSPGVRFSHTSPHHAVEKYLKRTRAPHTVLRPTVLLQTLSTLYRDDIRRRGEIVLPAAGAKVAFVDADDVGRAAARVLTEPGHLGKAYSLAGEQALSYPQVAEILTTELGRPIRYTPTSEADFTDLAAKQGASAADVAAQAGWYRAARRRLVAVPNRSIRRLTGRPARTLHDFVEENRQTWL